MGSRSPQAFSPAHAHAHAPGSRVTPCVPLTIARAITLHQEAYDRWQAAVLASDRCTSEKRALALWTIAEREFEDYLAQQHALLSFRPRTLEEARDKAFALLLHHNRDPFGTTDFRTVLMSFAVAP